jgi:hypothetical protein
MRAKLLLGLVAVLWLGMLLAVGMESIVKFDTPSLSRVVAFDEGRYVFHFFNKVQFFFLAVMLMLIFTREVDWIERLCFVLLIAVLTVQVYWLFPQLSHHVDLLLAGMKPPQTNAHALYGWAELLKITLLSVFGVRLLFQFAK